MLDTVHFKLHDIKKHDILYQVLINQRVSTFRRLRIDSTDSFTRALPRDVILMEKTGKGREVFSYHSHQVKSSHYTINIMVHFSRDCFVFNFSIPKYLYGTNIFQFIEHKTEPNFKGLGAPFNEWNYKTNDLYTRFDSFMRFFFKSEFLGVPVSFQHIEISRIDFCYNAIFPNKEVAFQYLGELKKVHKKYERQETNTLNNYKTAFFYANNDYSFKVYHKGSEYEKDDSKEHYKLNKEYLKTYYKNMNGEVDFSLLPYNIPKLQAFSDCILRYEMTFRGSYISTLFNHRVRMQKHKFNDAYLNKTWAFYRKVFSKIQSLTQKEVVNISSTLKNNYELNKTIKLPFDIGQYKTKQGIPDVDYNPNFPKGYYFYYTDLIDYLKRTNHPEKKYPFFDYLILKYKDKLRTKKQLDIDSILTPLQEINVLKFFYNDMNKFISKNRNFYLELGFNDMLLYKEFKTINNDFDCIDRYYFGNGILKVLSNKFWSVVDNFTLKDMPMEFEFLHNLRELKAQKKSKDSIDVDKMLLMFKLIQKGYKFDTLSNEMKFSKTTHYKYKKIFELCGVSNTAKNILYRPKFDFAQYLDEVHKKSYQNILNSKINM